MGSLKYKCFILQTTSPPLPDADYLCKIIFKKAQIEERFRGKKVIIDEFESFGPYSYSTLNIPRQIYIKFHTKSLFTSIPRT